MTNQIRIEIDMTINQKQQVMVRKLTGLIRIDIFLYRGQHKLFSESTGGIGVVDDVGSNPVCINTRRTCGTGAVASIEYS